MIIINLLVNYQLNFLKKYSNITDSKTIDKLYYGLSFINSELSKFVILIIVASFTKTLAQFLILTLLLPVRSLIGGHHAKNYRNCLLVTLLVYLSLIISSFALKDYHYFIKTFGFILFTLSIISKKCINNPNRPKRKTSYIYKQRLIAFFIVLGFLSISPILSVTNLTFGFNLIILLSFDFILLKGGK